MKASLMAGASSVAHLVGLGRLTGGGKPPGAVVIAVGSQPDADAADAPAGAVIEAEAEVGGVGPAVAAAPADVPVAAAAPADDDEGDGEGDDDEEKDDDETELKGAGKKARARRRERSRCRAIINSPHTAKNPATALFLALRTDMPRQQALAMLEAMPKGAGEGLDARMAAEPRVTLGDGGVRRDGVPVAPSWDAAFAKTSRAATPAANDTRSAWDRAMRR